MPVCRDDRHRALGDGAHDALVGERQQVLEAAAAAREDQHVDPAAGLAQLAKSAGARVVEINIAETPLTGDLDGFLQGPSGELLPQLIA